jgi:hypothetical protein
LDASYKPESGWDYQVIENLDMSLNLKNSKEANIAYIGQTCEQILENLEMKNNFQLFIELFKKALENFIFSKAEFHYIQEMLVSNMVNLNSSSIEDRGIKFSFF